MSRSRFRPTANTPRPARIALPTGLASLWPVLGLCVLVLAGSVLAFSRQGQGGGRQPGTCTTVTVPHAYASWDDFFAAYPFEDQFLKRRIEAANPGPPQAAVRIPLSDDADCR